MPRSIVLLVALLAAGASLQAEVTQVDSAALEELRKAGVPVVDIRTPQEWEKTGIIDGSHLLTFFDAEGNYDARAWLAELSTIAATDEPVAIICHSGRRSDIVSRFLDGQVDYQRVHDANEGISQWIADGRPTMPP